MAGGFRPPPGAHLNALTQRMPPIGGQMRTPQGSPMSRGPGGFMGGGNAVPSVGGSGGFMGGASRPPIGSPSGSGPMGGFMGVAQPWNPGMMDGPSQMMFSSLPQGTEEAFGFAPEGFTRTLAPGRKLSGFMGGMF